MRLCATQEGDDSEDEKYDEQHLRDSCGAHSNPAESEDGGDDGND